jgi:predicted RNase H-related nuclease YkuK (DUF458 family)
MQFRKINDPQPFELAEYIKDYLKRDGDFELLIGCDSQRTRTRRTVTYALVVIIYNRGKGGHVIYKRIVRNDIKNLHDRLWQEVQYAVDIATYLRENDILLSKNIASVHLDLNPKAEHKSNQIYDAAVGYVKGMGFELRTKPVAVAASYAADMLCR